MMGGGFRHSNNDGDSDCDNGNGNGKASNLPEARISPGHTIAEFLICPTSNYMTRATLPFPGKAASVFIYANVR